MSLSNKRIWFDIEEPKTAIMFNSLFEMFQNEGAEIFITARDFDSTYQILDSLGIEYIKVGKHGGEKLENKLQTYIDRLNGLLPVIKNFNPDYFITFSSVEGTRIAFGLKISSIGFNDEPRNEPVCKLIFPFLNNIITPECIPIEWYLRLQANKEKIIQYNGIDEIGWLSDFTPNPKILDKFNLVKGEYVLIRSEPSTASYFIDKLDPEETMIYKFFSSIYEEFPNYKYLLLVRSKSQENYLQKKLMKNFNNKNILITRYLPNIVDLCFFSALVISGGGTIVRESSLINVPSIEYFPGDTAPQERFLIKNGFPLEHIKDLKKIISRSIEIMNKGSSSDRFNLSFKEKINRFENPNTICYNFVRNKLIK